MKKGFLWAVVAVFVMVFCGAIGAEAAMTWAWTETGPGIIASGTFTTAGNASVPEAILSITGTRNGQAITGPVTPPGDDGSFQWDNLFSASGVPFTYGGVLLNVANLGHDNIYNVGSQTFDYNLVNMPPGAGQGNGIPVNFTASAVPIPGAIWLLGSGLLGLVAVRRRKTAS